MRKITPSAVALCASLIVPKKSSPQTGVAELVAELRKGFAVEANLMINSRKQKKALNNQGFFAFILAEAVRFELTEDSHPRQFSRLLV